MYTFVIQVGQGGRNTVGSAGFAASKALVRVSDRRCIPVHAWWQTADADSDEENLVKCITVFLTECTLKFGPIKTESVVAPPEL